MGGALHLGCRQSLKEDFTIALASEFDLLFIRSVPFLSLKLIKNHLSVIFIYLCHPELFTLLNVAAYLDCWEIKVRYTGATQVHQM